MFLNIKLTLLGSWVANAFSEPNTIVGRSGTSTEIAGGCTSGTSTEIAGGGCSSGTSTEIAGGCSSGTSTEIAGGCSSLSPICSCSRFSVISLTYVNVLDV